MGISENKIIDIKEFEEYKFNYKNKSKLILCVQFY